ncbi:ATP-binding cassette domain-containing protein [Aciditerrimonas ferrireducens]|nr:ATP-binding cassette domain-containing protein [Aciditerrimonas ferrireducens]MCK4178026.1 ATP-binding cassette domain-containing protein [Aciditerrimonas ferrireducens]
MRTLAAGRLRAAFGDGRTLRALAGLAGALVLAVVVANALPRVAPGGVLLEGAEYGAVEGLLAMGLVLTYRASRIVNFAYGAMGSLAATAGVELFLADHVNWLACLVLAVLFGGLVGLGVDAVLRRFTDAPRLVVTVATIGLAQGLGGLQLLLPRWIGGPTLIGGFSTFLSRAHVEVFPVLFTGNDLVIALAVPLVLLGLSVFLLRTDAGAAIRAVADNRDRALLLGIPVRRLTTLVWVIAGGVAALTTVVSAPSQGLVLSAAAGPDLLLPALAAAVVARMERLPQAFWAGVGLGVVTEVVQFNVSEQAVADVVLLGVILVALLLQRPSRSRAVGEETWSAAGVSRPIPSALRHLPEVQAARWLLGALAVGGALALPFVLGPGAELEVAVGCAFGMVAVSLVVLSGWAGSVSLGQFAIAGIGGVVAGDLIEKANADLFLALAAAGAAGAVLAVVVGLPALRIRGIFLAVSTLALAVAVNAYFLNPTNFSAEIPQSFLRPVLWDRVNLADGRAFAEFCLVLLGLTVAFVAGLRRARAGRVLVATRDNERAAAAMAVPTVRAKLAAFVLAGVVAGVAGGLYALGLRAVGFDTYDPSLSLLVFSMAVIGGLGSIGGALLGVGVIELASALFPTYQLEIAGFGLLVLLLVLPGGLAEALTRLRDRLLRLVAHRRGLEVPTLTADRAPTGADQAAGEELAPALRDASPRGRGAALPVAPLAGPGTEPALLCREVEVAYGQVQVLFGVDLEVGEGELVALLGTNGAGKSTLLKAVAGLARVQGGEVRLGGRRVTNRPAGALAELGVRLMPGGRGVFPSLSVEENLRLGGWLARRDPGALRAARQRVLALFPVLATRLHQEAGSLSGGEQQMLSLAMALMVRPRVLLLDELSLGLAPTVVGQLLEVVRLLHAEGVTVVVVEQSVNVALELAERAVFLEKGEVRFSGPTAELLARPDVLRSVFLAGAEAALAGEDTAVRAPEGRVGDDEQAAEPLGPPVLEVRGATKRFGGVVAVNGVDLTLHDGEVLGLIGHNGAGKTTLLDLVTGLLPLDEGRVVLGGVDIGAWPAHQRALAGLGRTFQDARLYPALTVAETIAVARERHLRSRALVAAGLRLPASSDAELTVAADVARLVEALGLGAYAEKLVGELSTGTRRIVELACVLAQDPAVLLLDEPSGGVAQRETEALGPLLRRVQQETGCAVLVIEHDMPLLRGLCDRLVALELGGVIAEGTPEEVLAHPRVVESYLGTDQAAIARSGATAAKAPA